MCQGLNLSRNKGADSCEGRKKSQGGIRGRERSFCERGYEVRTKRGKKTCVTQRGVINHRWWGRQGGEKLASTVRIRETARKCNRKS